MNSIAFAVIVLVVLAWRAALFWCWLPSLWLCTKTRALRRSPNALQAPIAAAAGYAGCADYAKAIVENGAPTNKCAPGGAKATEAVNAIMGTESASGPALHAVVNCNGGNGNCGTRFEYHGIPTCAAAAAIAGGPSACAFGCLGYGDCTRACQFDAIHVVNWQRCCGPRKVHRLLRLCGSLPAPCHQPEADGPAARGAVLQQGQGPRCDESLQGRLHCLRHVRAQLPAAGRYPGQQCCCYDYAKCSSCGTCVTKCPKKVIHWVDGQPAVAGEPA